MNKKLDKEYKVKQQENLILKSPIKFVKDFAFNEHAFLHKPTSTNGMAQVRSGMQFLALERAQILYPNEEAKTIPERLLRVAPIYFENEYLLGKKTKLEEYSRLVRRRLQNCIREFSEKKSDQQYHYILKELHFIAEKSS